VFTRLQLQPRPFLTAAFDPHICASGSFARGLLKSRLPLGRCDLSADEIDLFDSIASLRRIGAAPGTPFQCREITPTSAITVPATPSASPTPAET
jgi:hypothetical protein